MDRRIGDKAQAIPAIMNLESKTGDADPEASELDETSTSKSISLLRYG